MAETFSHDWEGAVRWLRVSSTNQQLVRDCYLDDPPAEAAHRYWKSEEWEAVQRFLPAGVTRILDVGAGRGITSYALAQEGHKVVSLEPEGSELVGAPAIRSLALESRLPISVVRGYGEFIPFPDNTFDVVFLRASLHHADCLVKACREFHRVLKPRGCFLALREHVVSRVQDLPYFLRQHPLHRLYGGENAFLLGQYLQAIMQAGFVDYQVLGPWVSPINWTFKNKEGLINGNISEKSYFRCIFKSLILFLRKTYVWVMLEPILSRLDQRAGRLYSFVAKKS